jgi:DNA-binding transcriptional MerR regulator
MKRERVQRDTVSPGDGAAGAELTVDQLARRAGTTTRNVRAFQTLGLLPRPTLRGRTGLYDQDHLDRLQAILRLQRSGFSLAAVGALFDAWERGLTLDQVLGVSARPTGRRLRTAPVARRATADPGTSDHLRAFDDWPGRGPRQGLAVVPTTVLDLVAS